METKFLPVEISKSNAEGYDARFVMSAATPDRVRDTIDPAAYKSLKINKLIALWQHDPDRPIGYWENVKAVGDRLVGDIKIAGTNLGQMIKALIADGVPLGASIGFRGKGEANKAGGVHFTSLELMECSIVSIPAHPRAMQIAKSFGFEEVVSTEPESAEVGKSEPTDEIKRAKAAILVANRAIRK